MSELYNNLVRVHVMETTLVKKFYIYIYIYIYIYTRIHTVDGSKPIQIDLKPK